MEECRGGHNQGTRAAFRPALAHERASALANGCLQKLALAGGVSE